MGRLEVTANHDADVTEAGPSVYVPPLQLTRGQAPPIAANGGSSYASFDRGGDAGTTAATEAALNQIAEGDGQAVIDMLDNAPPGPIQTKWGVGFRRYSECLQHIRANNVEAPGCGLALPLRYSVHELPSYSIVSSNALWRDPAREAEATSLKDERDNVRRCLYFPQLPEQKPTEVSMLKCYDSLTDGSVSRRSFHTTCIDPTGPNDAPCRKNVVVRSYVFF